MASPPRSPTPEPPTTPFLLKLFYRTGAFHRPDEFQTPLPHLQIYTTETCTLLELSHLLAATTPSSLPSPAIGTRLSFRLIYQNTAPPSNLSTFHPPRFMSKDLGSLVIGENGPGISLDLDDADMLSEPEKGMAAANNTLADAKFVVGDYISCAILPPVAGTGAVAPVIAEDPVVGRMGTGVASTAAPAGGRRGDGGIYQAGPRGRGGRGGGGPWDGGRERERDRGFVPHGEWRRGERLPDAAPRGGGRRGGRR